MVWAHWAMIKEVKKKRCETHPLDRDVLAVVGRMRLMCSALAGGGIAGDAAMMDEGTDIEESDPSHRDVDQTLPDVDIDRSTMSYL